MAIEVDLLKDFVKMTRTRFELDSSIPDNKIILMYAWHDLRRLPQKKWTVYYSNELRQNPFYINHRNYIDNIKRKAEAGENLSSHASTNIDDIHGKDEMLADWGIYHLHPGHGTKRAKSLSFVNRSKELLFVFPKDDILYFINIIDHNSWTNYSLIQTMDNNWPSSLEHFRLIGCTGLEYEPTEKELLRLRKNQINSPFRVGNSFYSGIGGGGGISADGSSTKAVQMADNISEALDNHSQKLQDNESILRKLIKNKTGIKINSDTLILTLHQFDPKTGKGRILVKNFNIALSFSLG